MRISINPVLFSHGRGGLEGDRPSSSLDYYWGTEVQHSVPIPQGTELYCPYLLTVDLKKRKIKLYLSLKQIIRERPLSFTIFQMVIIFLR